MTVLCRISGWYAPSTRVTRPCLSSSDGGHVLRLLRDPDEHGSHPGRRRRAPRQVCRAAARCRTRMCLISSNSSRQSSTPGPGGACDEALRPGARAALVDRCSISARFGWQPRGQRAKARVRASQSQSVSFVAVPRAHHSPHGKSQVQVVAYIQHRVWV